MANGNESAFEVPQKQPTGNIEFIDIVLNGNTVYLGIEYADGNGSRSISNCVPKGQIQRSYEALNGNPPTWVERPTFEMVGRDGVRREFTGPITEAEAETKLNECVSRICGTDAVTDDTDGVLTAAYRMYRDDPNAFARRTEEMFRDDSGTFERAFKLADIPVRIIDHGKDQWGTERYIIEAVNRMIGGASVKIAVSHDELQDGSWLYGLGGHTPSVSRLAMALVGEFQKRSKR